MKKTYWELFKQEQALIAPLWMCYIIDFYQYATFHLSKELITGLSLVLIRVFILNTFLAIRVYRKFKGQL